MLLVKKIFSSIFLGLLSTIVIFAQTKSEYQSSFQFLSTLKKGEYIEKTIILKVKPEFASACSLHAIENLSFQQLYLTIGGTGLVKKFPYTKAPERLINERGEKLIDLTLVYEFSYSASVSLEKIINKFSSMELFEYVEPHYIPHICFTPNDPLLSTQYAITNIQAENAWGVNTTTARGDTNVVIGITDTGTDPLHDDLKTQIKHNYLDVLGGGDTDGDGYLDNFSGWDLGENDNDPTWTANAHGVHVSGIAAAAVDNAIGVAGIGFNCKFLPVKIADAVGTLTQAYEGIVYAADHGCAVINCSWGATTGSQFGQDVVTYATINKNALVVAAAGNDGIDEAFYPASFNYVISVVNTRSDDRRSGSSNYNYTADVCAPGESINSTYVSDGYGYQTGTSMASPCAAGAAAIIKSFYPSYTGLQVGERLKITCDNIYGLTSPVYANKLGNGRINLFNALTASNTPSVVMTLRNVTDNNDNTFIIGDTLRVFGNYTNYLAPTTSLTATLSTTSGYVSILDNTTSLGAVGTLGVANNNADPFTIKILPVAPPNTVVTFKLTYSDPATSYTAIEYFTVTINVDYININVNDIATTISSAGRIGYSQNGQVGGLGFNYMGGGTLVYEAGLMVGTSGTQVSDAIRGVSTPDADFQSVVSAHQVTPTFFSDFDVDGTFNDAFATSVLPIKVHHKAFAWTSVGNRKYVIVQYVISNTGATSLTNLYSGIFADWDIDAATFASNRADFDAANKMGYAYYSGASGRYAGVKLLTSSAPVVHYAIDNVAGGAGGADLNTGGYDGNEKYLTMSTNRTNAGVSGAGADVIDVVSTGPYTIAAGDSIKVAFALIAGDDLADLQNSAVNAQTMYDGLLTTNISSNSEENTISIFPNPTNGVSEILVNTTEAGKVELIVFDLLGKEIKKIASENMLAGTHHFSFNTADLANGIYYYQLNIGSKKYVKKLIVTK
jgi:serine protease